MVACGWDTMLAPFLLHGVAPPGMVVFSLCYGKSVVSVVCSFSLCYVQIVVSAAYNFSRVLCSL